MSRLLSRIELGVFISNVERDSDVCYALQILNKQVERILNRRIALLFPPFYLDIGTTLSLRTLQPTGIQKVSIGM